MHPLDEGKLARYLGKQLKDNPYEYGELSYEGNCWAKGWRFGLTNEQSKQIEEILKPKTKPNK